MNDTTHAGELSGGLTSLAAVIVLGGAVLLYGGLWATLVRGRKFPEWTRFQPRPVGRRSLIDLLFAVALYVLLQGGLGSLAQRWSGDPSPADTLDAADALTAPAVLFAAGAGALLSVLASSALIQARGESSLKEIGWGGPWRRDLALGGGAFLLLAPPVYLVQTLLALLMRPSQHPLLVKLQETADPLFFLAAGFAAVVVAPIVEEYLFRGLLQGGLESLAVRGAAAEELPAANPSGDAAFPDQPLAASRRPPWWPTLASAALFAAVHFHGKLDPDPIALFLLALGLGYLYRQTHRLLPCIVVHMLLNGASMTMLALSLWT